MIQIKRIYSEANAHDGGRVLLDRVWPRGVSKERARIDGWGKEPEPSTARRKWFGHDPVKWDEFRQRYRSELTRSGQIQALYESEHQLWKE
jgi:uncharacterized protein YeaO (DUF488 family)